MRVVIAPPLQDHSKDGVTTEGTGLELGDTLHIASISYEKLLQIPIELFVSFIKANQKKQRKMNKPKTKLFFFFLKFYNSSLKFCSSNPSK